MATYIYMNYRLYYILKQLYTCYCSQTYQIWIFPEVLDQTLPQFDMRDVMGLHSFQLVSQSMEHAVSILRGVIPELVTSL